ncbi:MAG: hypothetical protein PHV85_11225 [Desulfovibrionaceae bacterium]|nr:hypothetical protein [Desulfovibrionaceae bacterium]MDD4953111.1 hypothetical protein [Desulfovibrionaceae bacterium]
MPKKSVSPGAEEGKWVHEVNLTNDYGQDIRFVGQLKSEDMHFNSHSGVLTVEKVYDMGDGRRAYGVISAIGSTRERRAYIIEELGDRCRVSNGSVELELDTEELLYFLSLALESESSRASGQGFSHMLGRLAANQ